MLHRLLLLLLLGVSTMTFSFSCSPSRPSGPDSKRDAAGAVKAVRPPGPASATTNEAAVKEPAAGPKTPDIELAKDISQRLERQIPVTVDFDEALVPAAQRPVLKKLVEAAQIMDRLFLIQVDEGNPALRARLTSMPDSEDALALFDLMYGPWDRLDEDKPFIGSRPKPRGVAYYPAGIGKEEVLAHMKAHPEDKAAFQGYFSVIRRKGDLLRAIPYSEQYREHLEPAARLLEEAAALSKDPRVQRYLRLRAKAFRDDDYYESDMAWMDLGDSPLEVVIGPYEVYEDGLFGYKAAFEAFICLRDPKDSRRLASIMEAVPELGKRLPLPSKYVVAPRGQESPLSVVVEVFSAGDTRAGVQTLAFNLPNDERVRQAKGSKKVMLRNVAQAKFEKILMPIARKMIAPEQLGEVTFSAFFNHTLLHETAHGMGPGVLTLPDGSKTDVGRQLKELYSVIEEAKADMLGLWGSHQLIDMGKLDSSLEKAIYASTLAGFFRSVRFGAHEAHGKANLIQFNWMLKHRGIEQTANGRFRVSYDKIRKVVEELSRRLLIIEAEGSYAMAKELIDEYGGMPESLSKALAGLGDIPVDIRPTFAVLEKMKAW